MLTPRQAEFLALAAQGLGRNEIADRFALSPWTVDNTFKAARATLEAANQAQAVVKAIACGALYIDDAGVTHVDLLLAV